MEVLETPEARFADLPGFAWQAHHFDLDTVKIAYLDEGPRAAPTAFLLHGEPTWSFLWRKVIPPLLQAGLRVVAPDLVGFGRSSKPASRDAHSFAAHVGWIAALVDKLALGDATLVCHDWGGLIGLRVAAEKPERFARIAACNTFLPTGDERVPRAFKVWRAFSQWTPIFPAGRIVQLGSARPLLAPVRRAYDAPFPSERFKAGPRAMPALVPARPDDPASAANRKAWEVLREWRKPFVTMFGDRDPITRGADRRLQKLIPGCAGQPHATLRGAGHFLQEDAGEELGRLLAQFITGGRR